eukprot:7906699-Heterocapsa_arctica.AAC.1
MPVCGDPSPGFGRGDGVCFHAVLGYPPPKLGCRFCRDVPASRLAEFDENVASFFASLAPVIPPRGDGAL